MRRVCCSRPTLLRASDGVQLGAMSDTTLLTRGVGPQVVEGGPRVVSFERFGSALQFDWASCDVSWSFVVVPQSGRLAVGIHVTETYNAVVEQKQTR